MNTIIKCIYCVSMKNTAVPLERLIDMANGIINPRGISSLFTGHDQQEARNIFKKACRLREDLRYRRYPLPLKYKDYFSD